MAKSASQVAAKWKRRLADSGDDMRAGVDNVKEAPGKKAAARLSTMRARMMEALKDGGKWQRNVGAVTLSEYQNAMKEKGIPRAIEGATLGEPKVESYMAVALPKIEEIQRTIDAMPNATDADRKARMGKWFDEAKAKLKKEKR